MELSRAVRPIGLLLVLAMCLTGLTLNVHPVAASSACSAPVAVTAPAQDLASRVAAAPAGTCFTLANGTYTFHDVVPKDGMAFIGASTSGVIIDGRGHENAFHGTADSVTIASMTFQDFDSSAGTKRQEQSPIRGTSAIWASNAGQMATNWVIDSIISQRNYAAGVFVGDHFTVRNSVLRNNGVTGLSGDHFVGGLFENNIVYGNGALQNTGVYVNGGGMKFGQAGTPSAPVIVRNNEVYDNTKVGIWCDIGCQGFHVVDNYIHDHVSRAVYYELSSNLVVRGNRIERSNTWSDHLRDFNAGAITVAESANALVENNYIEEARSGVAVRQTRRPASGEEFLSNYPTANYVTGNVTVRNNVHVNVAFTGISTGTSGAGLITNPTSIVFTGNSYDNMSGMTFWWNNGQRLTAAQWQAAGRDTVANGSGPAADNESRGPGTDPVTPAPTPAPAPPPTPVPSPAGTSNAAEAVSLPLRINSGGPAMIDARGERWIADQFYVGGNTAEHAEGRSIANTESDPLYRDERWGATGYDIPVGAGQYLVRLHHAEVFEGCQSPACREFSVTVEGETVVSDVDVYAEVGGYSALVVESVAGVDDGELTIRFSSSRQSAQVSGIEILEVSQPVTAPATTAPSGDDPAAAAASASGTTTPGANDTATIDDPVTTPVGSGVSSPGEAIEESTASDADDEEAVGSDDATDLIRAEDGAAARAASGETAPVGASGPGAEDRAGLVDDADQSAPSQLALEIIETGGEGTAPSTRLPMAAILVLLMTAVAVVARTRRHRVMEI